VDCVGCAMAIPPHRMKPKGCRKGGCTQQVQEGSSRAVHSAFFFAEAFLPPVYQ